MPEKTVCPIGSMPIGMLGFADITDVQALPPFGQNGRKTDDIFLNFPRK